MKKFFETLLIIFLGILMLSAALFCWYGAAKLTVTIFETIFSWFF